MTKTSGGLQQPCNPYPDQLNNHYAEISTDTGYVAPPSRFYLRPLDSSLCQFICSTVMCAPSMEDSYNPSCAESPQSIFFCGLSDNICRSHSIANSRAFY